MMTGREHNNRALSRCNALARWGNGGWMAAQIEDGITFTPDGLKVSMPDEVKLCSLNKILDFYEENGLTAITGFGV